MGVLLAYHRRLDGFGLAISMVLGRANETINILEPPYDAVLGKEAVVIVGRPEPVFGLREADYWGFLEYARQQGIPVIAVTQNGDDFPYGNRGIDHVVDSVKGQTKIADIATGIKEFLAERNP